MYITWRLGSTWMFDPWNNFVVKSLLFSIRFYSYIFSRDVWSVSLCLCCCRIFLAIYQSFSKHFFRLSFCCNRAMKNSVFFSMFVSWWVIEQWSCRGESKAQTWPPFCATQHQKLLNQRVLQLNILVQRMSVNGH